MKSLSNKNYFIDNGNADRSKENFQHAIFNNLNFVKMTNRISFHRSDFRGAQIKNCSFLENDFSRCDFIDVFLSDCDFKQCSFNSAEIFNCYFLKVNFDSNDSNSLGVSDTVFVNCIFLNQNFISTTLTDSSFRDCDILNSRFEMCSTDNLYFENCRLREIDFSEMHASIYSLTKCDVENVVFGQNHFASLLIKQTDLSKIKFKYRGSLIDINNINEDYMANLILYLDENERYYETVYITLTFCQIFKKEIDVYKLITYSISRSLKNTNPLVRKRNIVNILKALVFYYNCSTIKASDLFSIMNHLLIQFEGVTDITERIEYNQYLFKLKELTLKGQFDFEYLTSLGSMMAHSEFYIDAVNEEAFIGSMHRVMTKLAEKYQIKSNPYEIVGKREGSLIVDIVSYASLSLALLKLLQFSVEVALDIQISFVARKTIIKMLKGSTTPEERENFAATMHLKKIIKEIDSKDIQGDINCLSNLILKLNTNLDSIGDGTK